MPKWGEREIPGKVRKLPGNAAARTPPPVAMRPLAVRPLVACRSRRHEVPACCTSCCDAPRCTSRPRLKSEVERSVERVPRAAVPVYGAAARGPLREGAVSPFHIGLGCSTVGGTHFYKRIFFLLLEAANAVMYTQRLTRAQVWPVPRGKTPRALPGDTARRGRAQTQGTRLTERPRSKRSQRNVHDT